MHEMTVMAGLLEIIEAQARLEGFTRVARVVLEIGALSGVEPGALRFAFDVGTRGSVAAGAELAMEEIPCLGRCPGCGVQSPLAAPFDPCPACGGEPMEILRGRELRIVALDVE
ncbi:hydrogenase maturation nickel metallochaperone HypA [Mesoterricola silvestris]|uniref:Hydrogenase maturation factor HypA n=1 Tax=Mesoterricola silvestris TaxID=2927979 RepID=A0AA48GL19_9BACT|nr:hydrogenase maturation nickel metallochaperone HypA [Mesoterricola silvestris]BDU71410.1 putative hydrogenase nickel incorporation protein HypA [Mesoterricola silvestris]